MRALASWLWQRWRRKTSPTPLRALEFVAIDIETTGLDPRRDVIVAIAAVPFVAGRPCPEAGYTSLVNPGQAIPPAAQAIHGIRDMDVHDAPPAATALAQFVDICRGRPLVAHTAHFDLAVINRLARAGGVPAAAGGPVLDIGVLAHGLFPSWWDLTLEGLGRLVEVEPVDRHTARGDALTAGLIFSRLIPLLEHRQVLTLADALRFQRRRPALPGGPSPSGGGLSGP